MKRRLLAAAAAALVGLAGPAASQPETAPGPGTQPATPAQPQESGMCGCCRQMMAGMMQPGGMMGMQQGMSMGQMPMGQVPMSPVPAAP